MIKERLKSIKIVRTLFSLFNRKSKRSEHYLEESVELMRVVDQIMSENELTYFVDGGTLLGIIREGKLLSHDVDLDVSVYCKTSKEKEILRDEMRKKGFKCVEYYTIDGEVKEESYKLGFTNVDFYYLDVTEEGFTHYFFCRIAHRQYKSKSEFSAGLLIYPFELKTKHIVFQDIKIAVPENPESYLKKHYGEDWRIPQKNYHYWYDSPLIEISKFGIHHIND